MGKKTQSQLKESLTNAKTSKRANLLAQQDAQVKNDA